MEIHGEAMERAKKVQLAIFDVDGVLTEGRLPIGGTEGELFKSFFCRDGLGITLFRRAGFHTAVITGRQSAPVAQRVKELAISALWQGAMDKRTAYRELKEKFRLKDEEIAYIGDDLIDLPVMIQVGFPAAVADAVPEVRARAMAVSGFPGGRGAVREILEFILKAKGLWDGIIAEFLSPETPEEERKIRLFQ